MKNVLITGGPTNEYVDEVMKITNMSTGSLALDLAMTALDNHCDVTLVLANSVVSSAKYKQLGLDTNKYVRTFPVETTEDMYSTLKELSNEEFKSVVHTAAVADYKPEFSFKMEDLARKIAEDIIGPYEKRKSIFNPRIRYTTDEYARDILKLMQAGEYKIDNSSKISSSEENLTIKLTLTTKIIANLRRWFPGAKLIACKLLENVSHDRLIEVATNLCRKNDMDCIMANDLKELRDGQLVRYLVDKNGEMGKALLQNGEPSLLDYAREEWF